MSDDETPQCHSLATRATTDRYSAFGKHMENYDVETTALHRKLQSKAEALRILRKDLELFRTERDQFKLMAETLQLRYATVKRTSDLASCSYEKSSVASILYETRERNIKLTTEVEALKQKLKELQGDIEMLRTKERVNKEPSYNEDMMKWKQERTSFISHLESLKKKNAQLSFDFKALIDEKEELITERDAYKCKSHRLNHELLAALKANQRHPKFLDVDSILLENKYLHERLENFDNELELTKQTMNKYKTMLETKRKKGIIKIGSNSNNESILTHKQVKTMLHNGIDMPAKTETIQDLKSLSMALLDNLNDKTLALSHQKKTNKMLASKINELEQRLQVLASAEEDGSCDDSVYSPSQILLNGYCPSLVDSVNTNETTATAPSETAKSGCNVTEDSGTMSSEHDDSNKTSRAASDDNMSSMSAESGRSIISSEYGIDIGSICRLNEYTSTDMYASYKNTPSTTTDSGNFGFGARTTSPTTSAMSSLVPMSIVKERMNDLKDLPEDLAALVHKALHELDMRDFDEVVGGTRDSVDEEANEQLHGDNSLEDDDDTMQ